MNTHLTKNQTEKKYIDVRFSGVRKLLNIKLALHCIYQTLIRLLKKFFIKWDKWTPSEFDAGLAAIKSLLPALKLKLERSTYIASLIKLFYRIFTPTFLTPSFTPFLRGKKTKYNSGFLPSFFIQRIINSLII